MPKKQIDYQNTIIYKLVCKNLDIKDLYVGHTTNFKQRKAIHKVNCNNANGKTYNFRVYTFIRENGGWNNWDMIEVEKYICNDVCEARKRERYWIEELKATLNIKIPSRTMKEYQEEHKEKISQNKKEYREINKDDLIEKHKKYYKINKDELIEKQKEYYDEHKEEILEKLKEKFECPCGSVVCKGALSRHHKSKKHQEWEKKNE